MIATNNKYCASRVFKEGHYDDQKKIRLEKILKGDHRTTIVAVDHGLTSGPIGGINQEETLPGSRSRSTRRSYPPPQGYPCGPFGILLGLLA